MARPTIAESVTCSATPTTNLTTDVLFASISGGTNQLYLAFIELRDGSNFRTDSMSGGGLTWTRVHKRRDTQGTIMYELWAAFGSPGSSFQPTLDSFSVESGGADTSLAAVCGVCLRIPDADPTTPYANAASSDAGATDNANHTVTGTVGTANSLMVGAIVTRGFTVSTPDTDYSAVNNATAGSGGNVANLYVRARTGSSPSVGTDTFANTLNAAADWIGGIVEVREVQGTTLTWEEAIVAWTGGTHTALNTKAAPAATVGWTGGTHTLRDTSPATEATVAWTGGTVTLAAILAASAGTVAWTGGEHQLDGSTTLEADAATVSWSGGSPTLASIMAASTGAVAWTQPQVTLRSNLLWQAATVTWAQLSHVLEGVPLAPMVNMFTFWRRRRRIDD